MPLLQPDLRFHCYFFARSTPDEESISKVRSQCWDPQGGSCSTAEIQSEMDRFFRKGWKRRRLRSGDRCVVSLYWCRSCWGLFYICLMTAEAGASHLRAASRGVKEALIGTSPKSRSRLSGRRYPPCLQTLRPCSLIRIDFGSRSWLPWSKAENAYWRILFFLRLFMSNCALSLIIGLRSESSAARIVWASGRWEQGGIPDLFNHDTRANRCCASLISLDVNEFLF
ncbi:hypothetical protein H6P81_002406 [Aristolochia fimbriata]|uniref:Uncharacterized protein n=1 Tax=Aristolochia fimbriata TaxID=158543 RepID=A0AAV7F9X8_ARIFI|nr:hypothetical protein H6P81_002406 [Aristolochia fimbriata]